MAKSVHSTGYSGTPLPKKLGLKDGQNALFVAVPPELEWLQGIANFASVVASAEPPSELPEDLDIVHAFFSQSADLASAMPKLMAAIQQDGMIWISWPKRASRRPTDITEDVVRAVALPIGLVDVKVAAIDEVWSGLKLVIRKQLRHRQRS